MLIQHVVSTTIRLSFSRRATFSSMSLRVSVVDSSHRYSAIAPRMSDQCQYRASNIVNYIALQISNVTRNNHNIYSHALLDGFLTYYISISISIYPYRKEQRFYVVLMCHLIECMSSSCPPYH